MQLAGIEPVGIAGLGQELLRLHRIVRRGLDGERELEGAGDDVPRGLRGSQGLRLAQRPAIDGVAGGQAYPLIGPG